MPPVRPSNRIETVPVSRDGLVLRPVTLAIGLVLLVLVLNALLLRSDAPKPADEYAQCVAVTQLGGGFRHILNCDSRLFMQLARQPSLVFAGDHRIWQSRPLYPALAHVLTLPVEWTRRFGPDAPEYVAYALISTAAVSLGAILFVRLLTMPATAGGRSNGIGPELAFTLVPIMVNDVTKAFFWTPHLQMFNILMPCLTLYVTARLIRRQRPLGIVEAVVAGLALGLGLLFYGAVMVTAATLALVALVAYRQVLAPGLLLATFAIPLVCWVGYVRMKTGDFYSHEVIAYRQLVWIFDCAKAGSGPCVAMVQNNMTRFVAVTSPVVAFPLSLIALAVLGRRVLVRHSADEANASGQSLERQRAERAVAWAVLASLVVQTTFLAALGFYMARLSWALVPALLVLATLELRAWRLAMTGGAAPGRLITRSLNGLSLAAITTYLAVLFFRSGPYS